MNNKIKNEASASTRGTIHQFYVALDNCFDLLEGEKVFIETYGDVTVSGMYQIEVKHYSQDLTDLDGNIWGTINNWLQDDFDISNYKNLILLTTQKVGTRSLFKEWNNKTKPEKKKILDEIYKKYQQKKQKSQPTEKLLNCVLNDAKKDKLMAILDKFIIDSSPESSTYYEIIKQRREKSVLPPNRDDFINSLMGYLVSPEVWVGNGWEITYQGFTSKVEMLVNQFRSKTTIFPKKYADFDINSDKISQHNEHLFVKKIEDIDYHDVKKKAISDYVRTNYTISQELKNYANKNHYDNYEQEIIDAYTPAYNRASRHTNKENRIRDSKDFYDSITASEVPAFIDFNDTPRFFRNGVLHGLANDDNQNIIWKLKVDKDE
jgi:hypothetical protein